MKRIWILVLVILVVIFVILSVIGYNYITHCKQDVYIQYEGRTERITEVDDINIIKKALNKKSRYDTPACTFAELDILLVNGDRAKVFRLASDGCCIIKKNRNRYIRLNNEDWDMLIEVLGKYNISKDIFVAGDK